MTLIDAHLHIWDLEVSAYSWLGPQHGALHRSFWPADAANELTAAGVDSAMLVQAEDSLTDTTWLLKVAEGYDWVHGVVGWVKLDEPDEAARQLETTTGVTNAVGAANTALRGIRHLVHDDPRADFLDLPTVRRSLALVAQHGLAFDVPDAWPRHLDSVGRLAGDLPDLTVVIDHLGKPPRGGDDFAAWEQSLRQAARHPNVVAKLSGLQHPGQPFTAAALRPVLDIALDAFGAQRLMFGSDWPMTQAVGGYPETVALARELVAELSVAEQGEIWAGTAVRTYGPRYSQSHLRPALLKEVP